MNWKPPESGQTPEGWQSITPPTSPKKSSGGGVTWAGILGGLVVVLLLVGAFTGDDDDTPSNEDLRYNAHGLCKNWVEELLKAPSTAEHPSIDDASILESGTHWIVNSYVDAQNGFGAMLRTGYRCEIEPAGDDRWRLVDISLDE